MAKSVKDKKAEALAVIDAALTILERFPALDSTNINLSFNTSANPFEFLMDIFKSTSGYDYFLNIIATYLTVELNALELFLKGILIANIKNILSCSLNPIISDEILKNGIMFDLRRIDIMNILSYSPLQSKLALKKNKGRNFYFGCDEIDFPDQLRNDDTRWRGEGNTQDFNAFLWYMKNRANTREVWGKKSETEPENDAEMTKDDGVVTLEYHERSESMKDYNGDPLYNQTPYNNCIQVFIGNARGKDNDEYKTGHAALVTAEEAITDNNEQVAKHNEKIEKFKQEKKENERKYRLNLIKKDEYLTNRNYIDNTIKSSINSIMDLKDGLEGLITGKRDANFKMMQALANTKYRGIDKNYYYRHTLLEFNIDYVMSIKFFDSKVLAAQLIDALVNALAIDLNLSYEQLFIKSEVSKMVHSIIETDDTYVNDCFFAFANDEYDEMLNKSELIRRGFYTNDGVNRSGAQINADDILDSLNSINPSSSKQEIQTVIEGALTEISARVSSVDYLETDKFSAGVRINFIENLMNNLAYVITSQILSPKVYLLLAINLQILGQQTNFSLEDFINMHKQLIVELIRAIRDHLIQYLVNEMMKIIGDLAERIAVKLTAEQAQYYIRLIRRLIDCFRRNRGIIDFNIDQVDYADILESNDEPIDNEC